MIRHTIQCCPGTLAEGFNSYSPTCLKRVFQGKKVSHVLSYAAPSQSGTDTIKFLENRKHISISGAQEKVSLILEKNILRLTRQDERGNYILKPIPRDVLHADQVPGNEHLTMQIARQVYEITTAENALIFFNSGEPAYITKRFDVKDSHTKWGAEDFASLAEMTEENIGKNFKYTFSYDRMEGLLRNYLPAYKIELEKLYALIIFNFLFSNGDAHLKNFSVLETPNGDYILSPAYDLLNTRIHVNDTDFALEDGLFHDDFESSVMKKNGHAGQADFHELARRWGINNKRRNKILSSFLENQPMVQILVMRSFLKEDIKQMYLSHYQTKRNYLNML